MKHQLLFLKSVHYQLVETAKVVVAQETLAEVVVTLVVEAVVVEELVVMEVAETVVVKADVKMETVVNVKHLAVAKTNHYC